VGFPGDTCCWTDTVWRVTPGRSGWIPVRGPATVLRMWSEISTNRGSVMVTEARMGGMAIQNWSDAPEIHPSEIRVGDLIGAMQPTDRRYTVKLISGPQKSPRQWTFFGRDADGMQYASTFGEDELVRRYAKAS